MRDLTLMEDSFLNRGRARRAIHVPPETPRSPRPPRRRSALAVIVGGLAICAAVVGPNMRAGAASTTTTTTFVAGADAAVYQSSASTNYGSDTMLRTDGGGDPGVETYLRFDVSNVSGTVQSVKLQLSAMSDPTVDGPAVYPTATSWTEGGSGGITWNSRPATTGSALADIAGINSNAVIQYDVTKAVVGNGSYSFKLATSSTDGVNFYSRETSTSSQRPQLIVTTTSSTSGPSDTTAPTVSITSPTSGATVSGHLAVSANASDNVGVARVDYKVDGSATGSSTSSPWGYTVDTTKLTNATHTIAATAYDAAGNASAASAVSVAVTNSAPASSSCTLYASPSGSSSASGTSSTNPLTLAAATSKAVAGNTVCVMAGTYSLSSPWYVNRSGSPGKYIVFKSYGGTALLKWRSGASPVVAVTSGTSYVELNGLSIDGSNSTTADINCNTAKYVRVIGNTLTNGGAAGVSSYRCDYMTVDRNLIYHSGYASGNSSAISLNTNIWSDSSGAFHIFVTNNIISGTYDNYSAQTDGNGIIMDSGGNTPPVLIANNVVYENYYRCIHSKKVTHVWVVNNTCYKNGLRNNPTNSVAGEINSEGSTDVHVINDVVYTWSQPRPYKQYGGSVVTYQRDIAFGGTTSEVPSSVLTDPNQIRYADPLFVNPLSINAGTSGSWANALAPWLVGTSFQAQSGSPLINQGIDPRTATGMTSALAAGINQYLSTDLAGAARPQGGAYDIGAYER